MRKMKKYQKDLIRLLTYCRILLIYIMFIWVNLGYSQVKPEKLPDDKQLEINKLNGLLQKYITENNKNLIAQTINKKGYIYWEFGHGKEAIDCFKSSLEYTKALGNKNGVRELTNSIAMIYSDLENYTDAMEQFKLVLDFDKQSGNKERLISTYNNIALVESYLKQYQNAITHLNQSLELAQGLNNLKLIRACYGQLAEVYDKLGDKTNWIKYSDLFLTFDKAVKEKEMQQMKLESELKVSQAVAERQKKEAELLTQTFKLKGAQDSLDKAAKLAKEQQMELDLVNQKMLLTEQEKELGEKQNQIRNQKIVLISLSVFFVVVIAFSFLLLRENKQKKIANKLLEASNLQLVEKNELLKKQFETIDQQNKTLDIRNKEIEKKNQTITSSINYARKIQEAILPSKRAIKQNLPDSFIFYRPKDIVSGDFYWFSKREEILFIAAVDCTGHSVPGAFMSMIGNTLLNEIINEKQIYNPAEILEKLDVGVSNALKSEGDENNLQDGMDITLYHINYKYNKLLVSCAKHTSFVFVDDKLNEVNGRILSIGEKLPENNTNISITKFVTHEFPITSNTYAYMFSDGYIDQIGGPIQRKFMQEKLKGLLLEHHQRNLNEQYEVIESSFDEWRGANSQMDDVLVIGLKL